MVTFAFEEDILSNANPDTSLLEDLVGGLLEDIVASGNIPTGDAGTAGANGAALASFTSTYTRQVIDLGGASIPIGASDARYDVDLMVGQP